MPADCRVCRRCCAILTTDNWSDYQRKVHYNICKTCLRAQRSAYYLNNQERIDARRKEYHQKHKTEIAQRVAEWKRNSPGYIGWRHDYRQRYRLQLREAWRAGFSFKRKALLAIAEQAESLAPAILESEGFTDVFWIHNHHAAFDLVAKKNGAPCLIDVTISPFKTRNHRSIGNYGLMRWLQSHAGFRRLVLFITPDLRWFLIKEAADKKSTTVCNADLAYVKETVRT